MVTKTGTPQDGQGLLQGSLAANQTQGAATGHQLGQAPQVIIICAPPSFNTVYEKYPGNASMNLAIIRIVLGILCICIGGGFVGLQQDVISNSFYNYYQHRPTIYNVTDTHVYAGFWCGVMFMVSAVFGIPAGKTKKKSWIVTNMVMSIVVSPFYLAILAPSVAGILETLTTLNMPWKPRSLPPWETTTTRPTRPGPDPARPTLEAFLALYVLMGIIGLIYMITAIWSSVICCKAICCGAHLQTVPPADIQQSGGAHYVVAPDLSLTSGRAAAPPGYQSNPPSYREAEGHHNVHY